uniref:CSON008943 protein n=1 Tax=Culicoides sonorensis TaxID=179676 RepID=A0A336M399_CULSO
MYKYVQRRLRDIVEKTYSILDVQKTWTCNKTLNVENGGHPNGGCNASKPIVVVRPAFSELCNSTNVNNQKNAGELWLIPERKDPFTSGTKEKCHKKSREHHYEAWISALTWSSALVCGWYASQLLCLHRRNLGWDTRCCYSKIFMSPSRAFHTNILTKLAFATPFPRHPPQFDTPQRRYFHHLKRVEAAQNPSINSQQQNDSGIFEPKNVNNSKRSNKNISQYQLENNEELHDLHKYVINVTNEDEELKEVFKTKKSEKTVIDPPKDVSNKDVAKTVEDAVNDLLSVLGEIEFQLGVKSINVGDFETAVSHLKLATSHHHAGATFNLGICFENGLGIKQDMHHAMECYQAAADLGHPQAMYNLGIFYAQGLGGLKKSRKAARKCFETAARLGVIEAKLALGLPVTPSIVQEMPFDFRRTESAINLQQVQMNPVLVS